jgi:hypothetical protein
MMYCTKCGSNLRGETSRCPTCGYTISQMRLEDSRRRIGYKHSEIRKDPPSTLKLDENGDPIPGYSPQSRMAREEEERPRTLVFRNFRQD